MDSLTQVTIDFDTSHLIFPTLIGCILLLLGLSILATRWHVMHGARAQIANGWNTMDKPRFLGALALTLVYFSLMVPIGNIWPNTGMGFLICSAPYVLMIGLLFMHERSLRRAAPLIIVALVAPTLVWWLFTDLFFLTLP